MNDITLKNENVDNLIKGKILEFGWEGNCGVIRNNINNAIGLYTISINETTITLKELEIFEEFQNQGYGTSFIKKLFNKYPNTIQIIGMAMESAVNFYYNLKAEFHESCDNCIQIECPCNKDNMEHSNSIDYCDNYIPYLFKISRLLVA